MRYLAILLILTLAYAEDKPVPQPMEVQRAMSEYERGVYQARKTYDAAISKISGDIVVNLERAKKDYMTKGDLEGATLVAAAIKKINDGDALTSTEEKIKAASVNNLFKPTLEQAIIGKWKQPTTGETQVYNFDKTAEIVGANTASKGRWFSENGKVSVVWDRWGKCSNFNYDEKTGQLSYNSPDGKLFTMIRVK